MDNDTSISLPSALLQVTGGARARPASPPPSRANCGSPGAARPLHAPSQLPELSTCKPRPFRRLPRRLPGLQPHVVSSPWRRGVHSSLLRNPSEPPAGPAFADCLSDDPLERAPSGPGAWLRKLLSTLQVWALRPLGCQAAREKVGPDRTAGEKVMIEPNETMSE
ncbi:hypothetical protein QTO34_002936 [Cnephaeus nilssonii]|uniref:Uncharacterized protein n=1 Tax=Cnephaeus nilssonii TaxID=3371016 RepID=A0AA40LL23_CNENI|nr:hypothetical protein QTO34_002936 [Eptesicus nilssonii]